MGYFDVKIKPFFTSWQLCFVMDGVAWFSERPVGEVWGDDWDDAPYEHNAGLPTAEGGNFYRVAYRADLYTPAELVSTNSHLSVKDINDKKASWLRPWDPRDLSPRIYAGDTIKLFITQIAMRGGEVFLPVDVDY